MYAIRSYYALDDLAVLLVMGYGMGARADDGHFTLKHVDELRQFIQRCAAQEGAYGSEAAIALGGLGHLVITSYSIHYTKLYDSFD